MPQQKKNPKILLVANVSKEHVLKFHVPTIQRLRLAGWQVDVACSGSEEVPFCNHQFQMLYKRSPFNLALFKGIRQLTKIVKEGEYDIIYCHTPVGGVAARLAGIKARKRGTKVVYMVHGHYFFKGCNPLYWMIYYPIEKFLSRFTDSIITINREDFELTKNKFHHCGDTYLLNGIGIDVKRFQIENKEQVSRQYREQMNIPQTATVLIYLAELVANKNQTMLMRILQRIVANKPDVYLVLAGVDHSDGEFLQYAKELGIENNVRYLGWRSDGENLYAMADICVASSIREGFGLNIVEAMASGIPVVATDNRGHRTIIQNGVNGILVPIGEEHLFEQHILELIENREKGDRMVRQAMNEIDKFSAQTASACIQKILEAQLSL